MTNINVPLQTSLKKNQADIRRRCHCLSLSSCEKLVSRLKLKKILRASRQNSEDRFAAPGRPRSRTGPVVFAVRSLAQSRQNVKVYGQSGAAARIRP